MKLVIILVALELVSTVASAGETSKPAFATPPVEKNGLQVTVIGDKAVFAKNEPIKFTLRFKNVSDKPLSLKDAGNFENWAIRVDNASSSMPWRVQSRATDQRGPSESPRELKPGESVDISTDWGSNRFPFQYESELILNMPIPPADSLWPGRYRLWIGVALHKGPNADAAHLGFRGDINIGPVEIEISDKDDPKGIQASEAVKEKGVEFQTVARPQWLIPDIGAKSEVQVGLKIMNRTPTWMQVNAFDTVQVVLTDEHGKELQCVRERDATFVPPPLVLTSRESRTIYRNATLEWSQDAKSLRLTGSDGAGGHWYFDGLQAGKYSVRLTYENDKEHMKAVFDHPAKHAIDVKDAPFWEGKATARELAVEIVEE